MTVEEAVSKELWVECGRCNGTGKVPHVMFLNRDEIGEANCKICRGSRKICIPADELEQMVVVLRAELDSISNVVFCGHRSEVIVEQLLKRKSLNINSWLWLARAVTRDQR